MSLPIRISTIYLLIGALWILLSDRILEILFNELGEPLSRVQTLKGWAFIILTSLLLYVILRAEFNKRQQALESANEREMRFRLMFAANPLPMWVYDRASLRFLDVNDAACAHYGYSRPEFLSMRIVDVRPSEEIPRLMALLKNETRAYSQSSEWRHRTKEGNVIDVSTASHTLDFDGQEAVLVVINDVTETKKNEMERVENDKLRAMLTKESDLRTMSNRFISMISHEFRRPLTTITTSIELLEHYRGKMTPETEQRHFARIHEQLDETRELLDDFLALMRAEAAGQEFKPTPTDLTQVCTKLVEAMENKVDNSPQIFYKADCEKVRLQADEKLLRHAIGNLLGNAVKYSPNGGEVCLYLSREGATIRITVTDQGIGIPVADQAQIFTPFFRASNVNEIGGSGLGLSITKQAIELHSGTLELAYSNESGTQFLITLPITDETFLTGC